MAFEANSFSVVIDKTTADSLGFRQKASVAKSGQKAMFTDVCRVLHIGGLYACLSLKDRAKQLRAAGFLFDPPIIMFPITEARHVRYPSLGL